MGNLNNQDKGPRGEVEKAEALSNTRKRVRRLPLESNEYTTQSIKSKKRGGRVLPKKGQQTENTKRKGNCRTKNRKKGVLEAKKLNTVNRPGGPTRGKGTKCKKWQKTKTRPKSSGQQAQMTERRTGPGCSPKHTGKLREKT